MNPADLLKELDCDGAHLELSLRGSNLTKEHKALIREHRDSLLEHLARANVRGEAHLEGAPKSADYADMRTATVAKLLSPNDTLLTPENLRNSANMRPSANVPTSGQFQRAGTLQLYGDLLHSLMVWINRYHELTVEHPGGVILNARPEQAVQHLTASAWAVLSDETKTILATAGNLPWRALLNKTPLETTEAVQAALDAVARPSPEKVVN